LLVKCRENSAEEMKHGTALNRVGAFQPSTALNRVGTFQPSHRCPGAFSVHRARPDPDLSAAARAGCMLKIKS
jgi:hypothetical protein